MSIAARRDQFPTHDEYCALVRYGLPCTCWSYNNGHSGVAQTTPLALDARGEVALAQAASSQTSPRTPLKEETPMTQPTADTQALAQLDHGALTFELEELRKRPLTLMVVNEAKEWDSRAKSYLDQAEKSEVRSKINELFRQHKFWLSKFNAAVDPILTGRKFCASLFSRWEMERKRKADEERRERERIAREEQERQRKAEAEHLFDQGHEAEAVAHLESPLPPVALPDSKEPVGKLDKVTIIETYKLDRIIDAKALAQYLVEHPEDLIALFDPKMNEWKRRATSAKGQWAVPGVTFVMVPESRNRG